MENNNKKTLYNMREVANKLDIGLGPHKIYALLKENKIVYPDRSPYPEFIERGLFKMHIKIQPWNNESYYLTLVTEEGLNFIKELHQSEKEKVEKSQNFLPPKKPFSIEGYY